MRIDELDSADDSATLLPLPPEPVLTPPPGRGRQRNGFAQTVGAQIAAARRTAERTVEEASADLEISVAELVEIEAGHALADSHTLIAAATSFGTSLDFLCGLQDDSDRDPSAAIYRHCTARMTAEIQRLARRTVALNVDAIRAHPKAAAGRRLAALIHEAGLALSIVRKRNPEFDTDMIGGASLIARMSLATEAADSYVARVDRLRRSAMVRLSPAGTAGPPSSICLLSAALAD